ncbi:hypothetical protein [Pedosphaera parvula]|uniref:Uncharacterized protein n=1 Tax=Pedosphaera parvula (strain Ellin514) TaxID=320771 RepID=B9XSK4_PEDPL|nr:hypothetical protein [Pedosphaera parvula]EEF57164.1 hypothetical protein Cflav_PD0130 [Pedosphaera parvula Ellin514]
MKTICLSLLILAGTIVGVRSEDYRKDINPALRYYQGFALSENTGRAGRDYLLTNEWRGVVLGQKFGDALGSYKHQFRLMRAAAHAKVPCDWGLDLTEGPDLLLGHLVQVKVAANVGRLRAMWELQNGKQDEALDDLLATYTLARNVSTDGTLISVLVQFASENIVLDAVAENFYQFTPETLKQLEEGIEAAPPRGTVAQAMNKGERTLGTWFVRVVQDAQKQHPGDEAGAMASIRVTMQNLFSSEGGGAQVDRILKAAGGTSDGLLKLVADVSPMYDRAAAIMALPPTEYAAQIGAYTNDVHNSTNPLISELFPALSNSRPKEFASLVKTAMVHAAVEYKLHGDAGFKSVMDPMGKGPFTMERFVFEGVDRGFQVKSSYAGQGWPVRMIFVEKAGTPFLVYGKHAGEAAPKPTVKE